MNSMKRKAVVKSQPKAKVHSLSQLRGELHMHFCADRDCRLVYEDCCETPEVNGSCMLCKSGRRGLMASRDPRECCLGNCEQVIDRRDLNRFRLAGPGPWYRCKTCCRSHGWSCA